MIERGVGVMLWGAGGAAALGKKPEVELAHDPYLLKLVGREVHIGHASPQKIT